jgi:hypothetical protein
VTVEIVPDINALHGCQAGALAVKLLDLGATGVDGKLGSFTILSWLGIDGDTYVGTIEGPVQVGGIHKALHADSITGGCDLPQIDAPLYVTTVSGDVTSDYVFYGAPITIGTLSAASTPTTLTRTVR